MRILLDTHILLWYLEGNEQLSRSHRDRILNPGNEVFVSVASLWEIAIKTSIGKLKLTTSMTDIFSQLRMQSVDILQMEPGHILQVASLPLHHRDPFDRMLIAQAKVEFLSIITSDSEFGAYGVKLV